MKIPSSILADIFFSTRLTTVFPWNEHDSFSPGFPEIAQKQLFNSLFSDTAVTKSETATSSDSEKPSSDSILPSPASPELASFFAEYWRKSDYVDSVEEVENSASKSTFEYYSEDVIKFNVENSLSTASNTTFDEHSYSNINTTPQFVNNSNETNAINPESSDRLSIEAAYRLRKEKFQLTELFPTLCINPAKNSFFDYFDIAEVSLCKINLLTLFASRGGKFPLLNTIKVKKKNRVNTIKVKKKDQVDDNLVKNNSDDTAVTTLPHISSSDFYDYNLALEKGYSDCYIWARLASIPDNTKYMLEFSRIQAYRSSRINQTWWTRYGKNYHNGNYSTNANGTNANGTTVITESDSDIDSNITDTESVPDTDIMLYIGANSNGTDGFHYASMYRNWDIHFYEPSWKLYKRLRMKGKARINRGAAGTGTRNALDRDAENKYERKDIIRKLKKIIEKSISSDSESQSESDNSNTVSNSTGNLYFWNEGVTVVPDQDSVIAENTEGEGIQVAYLTNEGEGSRVILDGEASDNVNTNVFLGAEKIKLASIEKVMERIYYNKKNSKVKLVHLNCEGCEYEVVPGILGYQNSDSGLPGILEYQNSDSGLPGILGYQNSDSGLLSWTSRSEGLRRRKSPLPEVFNIATHNLLDFWNGPENNEIIKYNNKIRDYYDSESEIKGIDEGNSIDSNRITNIDEEENLSINFPKISDDHIEFSDSNGDDTQIGNSISNTEDSEYSTIYSSLYESLENNNFDYIDPENYDEVEHLNFLSWYQIALKCLSEYLAR